jgi:hypothetical protein
MSLWSRRQEPVVEELDQAWTGLGNIPTQRTETTPLDLALGQAHDAGMVTDPRALWRTFEAEHPAAAVDQDLVVAVIATHLGLTGSRRALLLATPSHLHAVDEQHDLVSWDFARLHSVGRISGGYPRLQVAAPREPGGRHLVIGTYELAPNRDTGAFWHELRDAVTAARPDLRPHEAGAYGGLGVPPAAVSR